MTKYDVTISHNRKRVTVSTPPKYGVDVNFEVPSKSIQYNNIILDDISSGFNGIGRTFSLYDDGTPYTPINDQQLLVGKNNYFLEPSEDFVVSGSSIIFTNPPLVTDDIFVIALVTTADLTRTVNFIVDSGNQNMTPGEKGLLTVDVNGIIDSWKIFAETPGNLQLDIQKSNYSSYPTFTSIVSGNYPTISNTNKGFDDTLTGWNTTILSGDIIKFVVNYSVDITQFLISFKLKL
jgi:hypothetical protein